MGPAMLHVAPLFVSLQVNVYKGAVVASPVTSENLMANVSLKASAKSQNV